jgi:hypothetical protein
MFEHADVPTPWDHEITRDTYIAARRIGEYAIPHARAAFAMMGADPAVEGAKHILAWLKRKGYTTLTLRGLFNGVRGRFQRMDAIEEPMKLLAQHGYIRWLPDASKKGPGRPSSRAFEVNPRSIDPESSSIEPSQSTLAASMPATTAAEHVDGAGSDQDTEDVEEELL